MHAIVPLEAKSAATLMCFGADQIFMGEFAELGPLDIQINDPVEKGSKPISPIDDFKSMEFLREYAVEILDYFTFLLIRRSGMSVKEAIQESIPCAIGLVRPLYEKIDPLEVGGHRRSLAIGEEYATRLLSLLKNPNCREIVEKMVWKYPSHDFAVDYEEASEMGLPVKLLDREEDIALVRLLRDLMSHEVPFYGFASQAPRQTKAKPARVPRRRPEVQAAAAGPVGNRVI